MTRKSHALNQLPLLGSNQDSPDPESVGFSAGAGKNGGESGDFRGFRAIVPTETHTVSHTRRPRAGTAAWWTRWTRYEPETGCVVFVGFTDPWGYARMRWQGKDGVLVHRVAYEQVYGPFDPEMKVCHTCDNPSCCNPPHLFLGTQKDNLRDMFAKGRGRPRGVSVAPLTFPDTGAMRAASPAPRGDRCFQ